MTGAQSLYRPLTQQEETARLHALKKAAELASLAPPVPIEAVQRLFDQALAERTEDLQTIVCIGIAFGETFLYRPELEWVRVIDEYGEENVIAIKGRQINAAPIAMVHKRILGNEPVDLAQMRDETIDRMFELINEGAMER